MLQNSVFSCLLDSVVINCQMDLVIGCSWIKEITFSTMNLFPKMTPKSFLKMHHTLYPPPLNTMLLTMIWWLSGNSGGMPTRRSQVQIPVTTVKFWQNVFDASKLSLLLKNRDGQYVGGMKESEMWEITVACLFST